MENTPTYITPVEYEAAVIRARNITLEIASVAIEKRRPEDDPSESWDLRALCAQTGPDAFYPERGITSEDAKKICRRCDVVEQCLEYALARPTDEDYGVWGNTTEHERRKIRKQRKQAS